MTRAVNSESVTMTQLMMALASERAWLAEKRDLQSFFLSPSQGALDKLRKDKNSSPLSLDLIYFVGELNSRKIHIYT
ncbi:hypothetical protein TNCV_2467131 [Trichonephila clavipes]|nr:hypothetical protein TNCV_2467131 [Trichonephila clavipes]